MYQKNTFSQLYDREMSYQRRTRTLELKLICNEVPGSLNQSPISYHLYHYIPMLCITSCMFSVKDMIRELGLWECQGCTITALIIAPVPSDQNKDQNINRKHTHIEV